MPTHAEIAAGLLNDAAAFLKSLADGNPAIAKKMYENARAYSDVATMLAQNPLGETGGKNHAAMAGGLLRDGAVFFRAIGESNPPLKDQMDLNADVFDRLSALVVSNPLGEME
jgi:hypothetical protein